jgi:hypothetical protein
MVVCGKWYRIRCFFKGVGMGYYPAIAKVVGMKKHRIIGNK